MVQRSIVYVKNNSDKKCSFYILISKVKQFDRLTIFKINGSRFITIGIQHMVHHRTI